MKGAIRPGVFNLTGTQTFDNICSHGLVSSTININSHIPSYCIIQGNQNSTTQFKDAKRDNQDFFLTVIRM